MWLSTKPFLGVLLLAQITIPSFTTLSFGPLNCHQVAPFNQTASAVLIAGVPGQTVHLCSELIMTGAPQGMALVEGQGPLCTQGTRALVSGRLPTGPLLTGYSISRELDAQAPGDSVCLLQNGTAPLWGSLTYAIF